MARQTWIFSEFSRSVMALLASRTHEWNRWSVSEGGKSSIDPSNVSWVEVEIEFSNSAKVSKRFSEISKLRALEAYEDLSAQAIAPRQLLSSETPLARDGWKEVWKSDKFLSEFDFSEASIPEGFLQWQVQRGSHVLPSVICLY